jgi:hypothetical protein
MKHIQTIHRFNYKGRIWETSITDDGMRLMTRQPPLTWDHEWVYKSPKKTPAYAMRCIRHCWTLIKDLPKEKFTDDRKTTTPH